MSKELTSSDVSTKPRCCRPHYTYLTHDMTLGKYTRNKQPETCRAGTRTHRWEIKNPWTTNQYWSSCGSASIVPIVPHRLFVSFRPCPSFSLFSFRPIVKTRHHASFSRRFFLGSSRIASHHNPFSSCPSPSYPLFRPTSVVLSRQIPPSNGIATPFVHFPAKDTEPSALLPQQPITSSERLYRANTIDSSLDAQTVSRAVSPKNRAIQNIDPRFRRPSQVTGQVVTPRRQYSSSWGGVWCTCMTKFNTDNVLGGGRDQRSNVRFATKLYSIGGGNSHVVLCHSIVEVFLRTGFKNNQDNRRDRT